MLWRRLRCSLHCRLERCSCSPRSPVDPACIGFGAPSFATASWRRQSLRKLMTDKAPCASVSSRLSASIGDNVVVLLIIKHITCCHMIHRTGWLREVSCTVFNYRDSTHPSKVHFTCRNACVSTKMLYNGRLCKNNVWHRLLT